MQIKQKIKLSWVEAVFFLGCLLCGGGALAAPATIKVQANVKPFAYLSVEPRVIDFGNIDTLEKFNQKTVTPPVSVSWTINQQLPWHIVVYSDNDISSGGTYTGGWVVAPERNGAGLVGLSDTTKSVPIKVWCANFGSAVSNEFTGPPDPNQKKYWQNNEEGWFRIPDKSDAGGYSERQLMGLTDALDSRLDNPFKMWLAADFHDAVPQPYQAAVFFDVSNF